MEDFAKKLADVNALWFLAVMAVVLVALYFLFRAIPRTKPYTGQLLLISAFCYIALVFFLLTFSFKVSKLATGATARTMPRVWIFLLALSSALSVWGILRGKEDPDKPMGRVGLVAAVLIAAIASVALFNYIGYYLSSTIFLVFTMALLGERNPVKLIAIPVGWVLLTYFVFYKLLYITLPVGSLFQSLLG